MRKKIDIDSLYRIAEKEFCPICKREMTTNVNMHHLIPKLKGGGHGPTVKLHRICHDKIHSIFSEREIQVKYNTIEKILENEEMQKFVKWVTNKPVDFYDSSAKPK